MVCGDIRSHKNSDRNFIGLVLKRRKISGVFPMKMHSFSQVIKCTLTLFPLSLISKCHLEQNYLGIEDKSRHGFNFFFDRNAYFHK